MAKHWIKGAIKHPGALHRELHVPEGQKIPEKKLEKAEHSEDSTLRHRAQLAETLGHMHHGEHHPAHNFPRAGAGAHGFGHAMHHREGHHRNSGHPSAHRIGKR